MNTNHQQQDGANPQWTQAMANGLPQIPAETGSNAAYGGVNPAQQQVAPQQYAPQGVVNPAQQVAPQQYAPQGVTNPAQQVLPQNYTAQPVANPATAQVVYSIPQQQNSNKLIVVFLITIVAIVCGSVVAVKMINANKQTANPVAAAPTEAVVIPQGNAEETAALDNRRNTVETTTASVWRPAGNLLTGSGSGNCQFFDLGVKHVRGKKTEPTIFSINSLGNRDWCVCVGEDFDRFPNKNGPFNVSISKIGSWQTHLSQSHCSTYMSNGTGYTADVFLNKTVKAEKGDGFRVNFTVPRGYQGDVNLVLPIIAAGVETNFRITKNSMSYKSYDDEIEALSKKEKSVKHYGLILRDLNPGDQIELSVVASAKLAKGESLGLEGVFVK